jgi:hypothetical protein
MIMDVDLVWICKELSISQYYSGNKKLKTDNFIQGR